MFTRYVLSFIGICSVLLFPLFVDVRQASAEPPEFLATQDVETLRRQHRRLPTDDIWWTVTGADMAWNFKNLQQLFPTAIVHRSGVVTELASRPNPDIANFPVETPDGPMRFEAFIESDFSTALGVVIAHRGEIVFERYPRMRDYEMPVYWSVAKAFVGILVRILEERGEVDVSLPIEHYIRAMQQSSFAGIPVRAILDMATGLDCADEYEDRASCYYRYSMAIGDGFRTEDAPDNPYDYAAQLKTSTLAAPGETYSYSGLNTFVLAWLIEEVTGLPFQEVFTREVWRHLGAESHAAYIAPRYGIPVSHGGFLARMRDVARLGILFTPSRGLITTQPVISEEHLALLMSDGNPNLRRAEAVPGSGEEVLVDTLYQWDGIYPNGTLIKGGWAGQGLIINPRWDLVAVFTSYNKDDEESEIALKGVVWELVHNLYGT